ncbi:hypothetical protein ADUPG1_012769 [Aduncisulcus paluster]|uniref:DOC domain-containing protein n=1 Tax=Aduncisulcus paluster TaxID=2918883 RepID=A0ABQ5K2M2_9EUKA|nr:hypothetical protein ADUPG1_012769 [Aduncisulcus paluster]
MQVPTLTEKPEESKLLKRSEYSVTAATSQDQAGRLSDGSTGSYWQSNGSKVITIVPPKTRVIKNILMYTSSDDGSYQPSRVTVKCEKRSGRDFRTVSFALSNSTAYHVLALPKFKGTESIIITIESNFQGGVNTRVRQLLLEISHNVFTVRRAFHARAFHKDVKFSIPEEYRKTRATHIIRGPPTDVKILTKGGEILPAHLFPLAIRCRSVMGHIRPDEEGNGHLLDLSKFEAPAITAVVQYIYSGEPEIIVRRLRKTEDAVSSLQAFMKAPENKGSTDKSAFSEIILDKAACDIFKVAKFLGCKPIITMLQSYITAVISANMESEDQELDSTTLKIAASGSTTVDSKCGLYRQILSDPAKATAMDLSETLGDDGMLGLAAFLLGGEDLVEDMGSAMTGVEDEKEEEEKEDKEEEEEGEKADLDAMFADKEEEEDVKDDDIFRHDVVGGGLEALIETEVAGDVDMGLLGAGLTTAGLTSAIAASLGAAAPSSTEIIEYFGTSLRPTAATPIVGSRVRVKPDITPAYGWGTISAMSVGEVVTISGTDATVNFLEQDDFRCRLVDLQELEIVH